MQEFFAACDPAVLQIDVCDMMFGQFVRTYGGNEGTHHTMLVQRSAASQWLYFYNYTVGGASASGSVEPVRASLPLCDDYQRLNGRQCTMDEFGTVLAQLRRVADMSCTRAQGSRPEAADPRL